MSVKPFTPAWLERLVRRCLAKDPEDRYYSMHDVVLDLRTPLEETAAASSKNEPVAVGAGSRNDSGSARGFCHSFPRSQGTAAPGQDDRAAS